MLALLIIGNIIIGATGKLEKRKKKQCVWSGLQLFWFAALHDETVGIDTATYYTLFRQDASMSFNELLTVSSSSYEQGRDRVFHICMHFLSYIWNNPQIMIILISAMVAICLSIVFYKYSDDVTLSFVLFICIREYSFTIAGLRQAIAMSAVWLTLSYINKKEKIKFFITTAIAGLFHAGALLYLVGYPIAKIKKTHYLIIMATVFLLVCVATNFYPILAFANLPFIGARFASKLQSDPTSSGMGTVLVYLAIFIVFTLFNRSIRARYEKSIQEEITLELNFSIITIFFFLLGFEFANIIRVGSFFSIGLFLLFPRIFLLFKDSKIRMILKILAVVLLATQYIILGPEANIQDYTFFWQVG